MAVQFNVAGSPDRFASKGEFFWDQVKILLAVFVLSLPLQIIFLVLPTGIINMPNWEYWFAPERVNQTRDRLSDFGSLVFGIILLPSKPRSRFRPMLIYGRRSVLIPR